MIPTISVLTPVHDGARFLGEALASARAQTWAPHEIIVVDDGSTDDSAAIAEAVPGVTCLRTAHAGVAAARNRLLEAARGELVAFLDADDVWTPDKLEVQVGYMLDNPDVGVTFTNQVVTVEPGVERPYWLPEADVGRELPAMGTCTMVARRELFARVGGFDVARRVAEDTDWIVRAVAAGVTMLVLPRPLLRRRMHGRNLSADQAQHRSDLFALLRRQSARRRGESP